MSVRKERVKRSIRRSLKLVPREELEQAVNEIVAEVDEVVESIPKEVKPGDVINGYKVAWTWGEMLKRFPIVTFTPEETIPLTWNGVRVQALSQIEMHVPQPFKAIYDQHRREMGRKVKIEGREGFDTTIALGAGALEPLRG